MPRFGRSLQPINSIKHIIDTEGALTGGGSSSVEIAIAVPNVGTSFVANQVRVGAKVNGFFLSVFAIGATGSGQTGSINWFIMKLHSGQTSPTPGGTGTSDMRNQIIHEEKGLAGSADGTPMAFKGVVVVPRGMRRMREGDRFLIKLVSTDATNDVNFCVKAIYKSFF